MDTDLTEWASQARRRLDGRSVTVIGLGGIGSPVAQAVAQVLASLRASAPLYLVDGDGFEERNRARVLFQLGGNKAISKAEELSSACDGATIVPVPAYVTPATVHRVVCERGVVLLAVDNHATRRTVSNRCRRLRDVVLISGGNDGVEEGRDGTFGNVMVHVRKNGRDATAPLTRFHPEIATPRDRRPDQVGCAVLAQSVPQLLFTNLAVASAMLGALYSWLAGAPLYDEVFLDIREGRMQPVRRSGTQTKRSDRRRPA